MKTKKHLQAKCRSEFPNFKQTLSEQFVELSQIVMLTTKQSVLLYLTTSHVYSLNVFRRC